MKSKLKTKSPKFTKAQQQQIEELFNLLAYDGFCPVVLSSSAHHVHIMHLDKGGEGVVKMLILNDNGNLVAHQQ